MSEWEYLKIDLSVQSPRRGELDLLNDAGMLGWELVGITGNNFAYLKRPVEVVSAHANGADAGGEEARQVQAKYRDPVTNDTWSGRGRMANWLRRKQEAGEDIGKYLI